MASSSTVILPDTSVIHPDTSVILPDTSVILPDTSVILPDTSVIHPDTSVIHPDTSSNPDVYTKAKLTISANEIVPGIDVIDDKVLNKQNSNHTTEDNIKKENIQDIIRKINTMDVNNLHEIKKFIDDISNFQCKLTKPTIKDDRKKENINDVIIFIIEKCIMKINLQEVNVMEQLTKLIDSVNNLMRILIQNNSY